MAKEEGSFSMPLKYKVAAMLEEEEEAGNYAYGDESCGKARCFRGGVAIGDGVGEGRELGQGKVGACNIARHHSAPFLFPIACLQNHAACPSYLFRIVMLCCFRAAIHHPNNSKSESCNERCAPELTKLITVTKGIGTFYSRIIRPSTALLCLDVKLHFRLVSYSFCTTLHSTCHYHICAELHAEPCGLSIP
eukprot:scaffold137396_cov17-Tisochrysis_lutea.AAC.4